MTMTNDQKDEIELAKKCGASVTTNSYQHLADEVKFYHHKDFFAFVSAIKEQMISEGWRQCAKGQGETQFRTQAEAVRTQERESGRMCNCVDCAPSGADCGCHQGPEKCHYCEIVGLQEQVDQERANKVMLRRKYEFVVDSMANSFLNAKQHIANLREGIGSFDSALQNLSECQSDSFSHWEAARTATKQDTDAFIAEVKAGAYSNLAQSYRMSQKIYGGNVDLADELDRMAEELRQSAAQPERKGNGE